MVLCFACNVATHAAINELPKGFKMSSNFSEASIGSNNENALRPKWLQKLKDILEAIGDIWTEFVDVWRTGKDLGFWGMVKYTDGGGDGAPNEEENGFSLQKNALVFVRDVEFATYDDDETDLHKVVYIKKGTYPLDNHSQTKLYFISK